MSKTIKTPAVDDSNQPKSTYTSVINGVQYAVEASSVAEAQMIVVNLANVQLGEETPSVEIDETINEETPVEIQIDQEN